MRRPSLFDRSLKVLVRRASPAFFRLAGVAVDPACVRCEDVSVNLPEKRADQVFVVRREGKRPWAAHIEYQLKPRKESPEDWFVKNAGLIAQLRMRVILIAVYLHPGRRAHFPDAYVAEGGGLRNTFTFHTVRLWEHAERIRSGELADLAPLLVLCENKPTGETLEAERELILASQHPTAFKADLLSLAISVASRSFPRDLLLDLFKDELPMLKEASIIEDWIAEGEARGRARGEAIGEARGRSEEVRELLLAQLRRRFGSLPRATVSRIRTADAAWCRDRLLRVIDAPSLEALDL